MSPDPKPYFDLLIVDDDEEALEELRDVLVNANLSVLAVSRPTAALQLMRENEFGVLITDVRMPDITGMMLAALLREEFKQDPPELIFISAFAERDVVLESIRHSPSGFLLKPIDARELLQAVFRALGTRSARRAAASGRRPGDVAEGHEAGAGNLPAGEGPAELAPAFLMTLLHEERLVRERLFHPDVANTHVWQLILDLYRVEREGGHNFVSSIALTSGLPLTTALRYIEQLVALGYVNRARDSSDARRTRVSLTPECTALLERYTAEVVQKSERCAGAT